MSKTKSICNSKDVMINDGKCNGCGRELDGLFVVTHYYDILLRGKDNDYYTARCPKCSKGDKTWDKYYVEQEEAEDRKKIEGIKRGEDPFYFARVIAENCSYETEYDGQTLEICFYCGANLWDGEDHSEDCAYIIAKGIIGGTDNKEPEK